MISRAHIISLINNFSQYGSDKIDYACMAANFPPRLTNYADESGYMWMVEEDRNYLFRIINYQPEILIKFIESILNKSFWVGDQYYTTYVDRVNAILDGSQLFYDINSGRVIKILTSFNINEEIKKYLLDNNLFDNYTNAIKSRNCGFHIASLLYLRRLIEELVFIINPKSKTNDWIPFDELYDNVKENFSSYVKKHMKTNFKTLSVFVHGSNEQEASKYFEGIKTFIDAEILSRVHSGKLPPKIEESFEKLATKLFNKAAGKE